MVEHRLAQFAACGVGDIEQVGAAVHGHGEFLAGSSRHWSIPAAH